MTVTITESGAETGAALARMSPARPAWELPPALADGIRVAEASARLHADLQARAERLIERLGPGAVLPGHPVRRRAWRLSHGPPGSTTGTVYLPPVRR